MANSHTDKPQSRQELRRRLLPRDDQEGFDAVTIRKDPHERVSYSARQTENPTDVFLRIIVRYVRTDTYKIYDYLRCTRAVLLSIDSYWL